MRSVLSVRSLLFALVLLAISAASSAQAGIAVSIRIAPPDLPVYEQPICPEEGYIWTPGYWAYGDEDYFWVPGTWVQPPRVGVLWTPGYWAWGDSDYYWVPGAWVQPPSVGVALTNVPVTSPSLTGFGVSGALSLLCPAMTATGLSDSIVSSAAIHSFRPSAFDSPK